MIIPAATFRLLGYYDEKSQKIKQDPQDSLIAFAISDQGNLVALKFSSNKKDFSFDDFKAYIEKKESMLVNKKDIDKLASEIEFSEEFDEMLEKAVKDFMNTNPGYERRDVINFKKNFKNTQAEAILRKRRKITKDTVIRVAVSTTNDTFKKLQFGNRTLNIIESRSIMFDNAGAPSPSGFYIISQSENVFPVEIVPIFKQNGTPLGLFKILLAKHASLGHAKFLTGHVRRTIEHQLEAGAKPFFSSFEIATPANIPNELKNALFTMNKIARDKNYQPNDIKTYLSLLSVFEAAITQKPELLTMVQVSLGIMFDAENIKIFHSKENPLISFPKNAVNLNFGSQNPDIKNRIQRNISQELDTLFAGQNNRKIISAYFVFPAPIGCEPESWGYMHNNFQIEKTILSSKDSFQIIKKESSHV